MNFNFSQPLAVGVGIAIEVWCQSLLLAIEQYKMNSRSSYTVSRQVAIILAACVVAASAFQLPHGSILSQRMMSSSSASSQQRVRILEMASDDGSGPNKGSNRKRRKRKKTSDSSSVATSSVETSVQPAATQDVIKAEPSTSSASDIEEEKKRQSAKEMAKQILAQEQMMYDEDDLTTFTPQKLEEDDRIAAAAQKAGYSVGGNIESGTGTQLEDLFDSREFLQRKREKQLEDAEKEGKPSSAIPTKKKIKRSDIEAYNKLLEMDPLADEDRSYFEDEGIDFISALLGDVEPGVGDDSDESKNKSGKKVQKKTSFLGIGSGPLQVGHTFGALSLILCAFVEYPGFPLTNLPDQLRGALQGGTFI